MGRSTQTIPKRSISSSKVIDQDFADPSLLQDGNGWYAFATNNHKTLGAPTRGAVNDNHLINAQVAQSADFSSWSVLKTDALPDPGTWTDISVENRLITQQDNDHYVMYYSAVAKNGNGKHCVGAATARNPQGPYTPSAKPLACPVDQGGAIDISGFQDTDGSRWVVYKIDGNSITPGGACGNNDPASRKPTPIILQKVTSDGVTPIESSYEILNRDESDGPLIEAPALARTTDGKYILFFSSNCFSTKWYDLSYAFADSITGPYVKRGPFAVTGDDGLYAPGGADIAADAVHLAFHAGDVGPNNTGARGMYTATLAIDTANEIVNS
ncbi:hypothetical protein FH972_022564 [Carpinus fangiana]|uniref:Glycoside hydrolase family 43 protein n=1 Tax=Carpinus fangiana TaxID=176857 RepID=A0A5N6KT05_9ROSI|nr:hypothetical protein FH972_022564 [Carpinus fangiana]